MDSARLNAFYSSLQKACLPGVWSKGVALAREGRVQLDLFNAGEVILRVKLPDRAVSPKVTLWPEDEDYFCDCGERADPCPHVAAAVAALRTGLKPTAGEAEPVAARPALRYRFRKSGRALHFERWLGDALLKESLVSRIGGQQSGRIPGPPIVATQDDLAVDRILTNPSESKLDRATAARLLPILRNIRGVELEGEPIELGTPTRGLLVELRDDGAGFRLEGNEDPSIHEVFDSGVLLCGQPGKKTLRLLEDPGLTAEERQLLAPPGRWFSPQEVPRLVSEVLPALERKLPVTIKARRLPAVSEELRNAPPRAVVTLEHTGAHVLTASASIEYPSAYSAKDPLAERELLQKLKNELHLLPGHRVEFRGMTAIEFAKRAQGWEVRGNGAAAFALEPALAARFEATAGDLNLSFQSASGKSVDGAAVLRAWRENELYVPLLGGGYAPLPTDWLARYGRTLERLLALREQNGGHLPPYARPELASLSQELTGRADETLASLQALLRDFKGVPRAPLPQDLRAELRHYQREGVDWLAFLRDSGMGALLADDMGLGKTLQTLCALRGKTLVVAPTSVLHGWREQIEAFRPGLKVSVYHGGGRALNEDAGVTLTSYGLLRQDRDLLTGREWDTVVLDEAQTIKNPESQVAMAAHALRGRFRVALSGTPVENRMEDLWSQFQFLNPGLLGSREAFQAEFASPIARGDEAAATRLRALIRPFILRRMKREVAPELPPRTEVVLRCELSAPERELYDSLLAASRDEVLRALGEGQSVFGALELLLRLRQACCHPALVPGQAAPSSAKLELLSQSLESSLALGHRALVFSQWTSFLDLIEPRLREAGITFLRLDGSTRDRAGVVAEFQRDGGPQLLLISLKAGGVGLNLTAADHVYLMDSWWNPAVEEQAADRAHRIGQENPVLVCRLVTEDTVEERILELQKRKLALSDAVLRDGAGGASLTREDLLALLA